MSYVIKFQAPFERLKQFNETMPDLAIRKAIILQAIIDASNKSPSKQAKKLEMEAKGWLFSNSEEFNKTCYEAGLEPDFVVRVARNVILIHHDTVQISESAVELISQKLSLLL